MLEQYNTASIYDLLKWYQGQFLFLFVSYTHQVSFEIWTHNLTLHHSLLSMTAKLLFEFITQMIIWIYEAKLDTCPKRSTNISVMTQVKRALYLN